MTERSSSSCDISASLRSIDSLIDLWFDSSTPPHPPPTRPLPAPPTRHEKPREHAKYTVNKLLLRAHAALTYSSRDGSTQTLCYADRAHDLAVEHRLPKHRGRAQWFRGEALARMERWEDAYEAFISCARVVVLGGWRKEDELRERMDVCWEKREERRREREQGEKRNKAERHHTRKTTRVVEEGEKNGRRNVRFQIGERVISF